MDPIDLKPFCSTDPTRLALNEPHVCGGWKYATDGRVLVCLKTTEPDSVRDNGFKFPLESCVELLTKARSSLGNLTAAVITPFPPPKTMNCGKCDGLGGFAKCKDCHGEGSNTCGCHGRGIVAYAGEDRKPCDECDGTGEIQIAVAVKIGASWFSNVLLAKLLTLPRLTFYPDCPNPSGPRLAPHIGYFTFGENGDGLLMPMREWREQNA